MFSLLRRLSDARSLIEQNAGELIQMHDNAAYLAARDRAREYANTNSYEQRHWNRVAVRIAKKIDYVIGLKAADRYFLNQR